MQFPYTEIAHQQPALDEEKKSPQLETAITVQPETFFLRLPKVLRTHTLQFLTFEDRIRLFCSNKPLYDLLQNDPDLLNFSTLSKMIKEIDQSHFTTITISEILGRTTGLATSTLLTWGTVELGKLASEEFHSSLVGSTSKGIAIVGAMAIVSIFNVICLAGTSSRLLGWYGDDHAKLRPAQAIGNLRKMIEKYNDIFPNNQLGTNGENNSMDINNYRDRFKAGIEAIRYSTNNNLGQAYKRSPNFFPSSVVIEVDSSEPEVKTAQETTPLLG